MLNIVIPMAGLGSRFIKAGYATPKPFIDVVGQPMIQRVVNNIVPLEPHDLIFIARTEHKDFIKRYMSFATNVLYVDKVTEGAACTVLLAKELIDNSCPLMIANSDQFVIWNDKAKIRTAGIHNGLWASWRESDNVQDMINDANIRSLDATIATFHSSHPKWSYAKLNKPSNWTSHVVEVAEKKGYLK